MKNTKYEIVLMNGEKRIVYGMGWRDAIIETLYLQKTHGWNSDIRHITNLDTGKIIDQISFSLTYRKEKVER